MEAERKRQRSKMLDLADRLGMRRAGFITFVAKGLGIRISAVAAWRQVPPERVPEVARLLGVERHQLRPDLWDPPPRRRCAAKETEPTLS